MAVWSLGRNQPASSGGWMALCGTVGAGFSVLLGLVVLFVVPVTSVYFSGFILITLTGTLLASIVVLVIGKAIDRKKND